MNNLVLSFAHFLYNSKRYRHAKVAVKDLLTNQNSPYKRYLDITIIFLIITSVAILVYEVKHPVPPWIDLYDIYFVSFIFAIEYLLRLWIQNNISEEVLKSHKDAIFLDKPFNAFLPLRQALSEKLRYMITPWAIIDLLAIFPAYRPIRVLRIFILFRVLKLLRYAKSMKQFVEVLENKRFELYTLLFLLAFIVITAGIAIYVLEEKLNPNIKSLFDALYWALVTISTVGFGDISPVTTEGRAISMFIIISGIAMISFATSVIVSAFSEKLNEVKESRAIDRINKSSSFVVICGYGQMAKMFLRKSGLSVNDYIILEKNPERVEAARKEGYSVIQEDASHTKVLERFNVSHAKITVLTLTASDVENIYITLTAKSISRKIQVIARASNHQMVKKFEHAGADHVVLPNEVANNMIHIAITQPTMYKALHAVLTGKDAAQIYEIHIKHYPSLVGRSIESLSFADYKLLFLGVHKNKEFLFNPKKEILLELHDVLLVIGREISLEYFEKSYKRTR
ncbi:MAG: NAD-binding protein [Sulfurovum sp.]|nr:NAD-binding protein [Sulfurovum sp.]